MIVCGWCGHQTPRERCTYCGRDPVLPWTQRGQEPEEYPETQGRPELDGDEVRRLYNDARAAVVRAGKPPTVQAIADELDRSARTIRAWRARFALE